VVEEVDEAFRLAIPGKSLRATDARLYCYSSPPFDRNVVKLRASVGGSVFGNGSSAECSKSVSFGPFEALVCEDRDLAEDLVSTNPFLDAGFNLHMDETGGYLRHPETGESISVLRDGPRWVVNLEDVAALRHGPGRRLAEKSMGRFFSVKANSVSVSESQRQRVLRLHERMGQASQEAMVWRAAREGHGATLT
jgi:hypothetical protein